MTPCSTKRSSHCRKSSRLIPVTAPRCYGWASHTACATMERDGAVTISSGGKVKIEGAEIEIAASGTLTLKGAKVDIN